jgi:hypothetical protein
MAKYNTFVGQYTDANPVKLISLFFDVLIHLSITGDNFNACKLGLPFSSSGLPGVSSPFAVVLTFALVFVIIAIIFLVIKYWSIRKCEGSCSFCGRVSYDFLSVFMGALYLIGDNLSDDVCRQYNSCLDFSITSTTCRIKDNRECNITTCRKITTDACKAEKCGTAAIVLLGASTALNLLLIFLDKASLSKPALPAIGISHKHWMSAFDLLTYAIFFDQTLTALHTSIFTLTSERQVRCDITIHAAGITIHVFAVLVWIVMLGYLLYENFCENCCSGGMKHCFRKNGEVIENPNSTAQQDRPGKKEIKKLYSRAIQKHWSRGIDKLFIVFFYISVGVFFLVYINADTPWPWDCSEGTDRRRKSLEGRMVLFVLSFALIILFLLLYFIIVFTPSIHEQCHGNKALDDSEVLKVLRNLPTSNERFRLPNEKDSSLHISYKFDEDIMTASYTVSITNDHEWTSTYQKDCTRCPNEKPCSGDNIIHINGENVGVVKRTRCNDSHSENDVYLLYDGTNTPPGEVSVVLRNCSICRKQHDNYVSTADSSTYAVLWHEIKSAHIQEGTSQHGENSGSQSELDNTSTLQPGEDERNSPDSNTSNMYSSQSSTPIRPQPSMDSMLQVDEVESEQSIFEMQVDGIPQGIVLLYPNGLVFRQRKKLSNSKLFSLYNIHINVHKHNSIVCI